jgi:hypothetical protein
MNYYVYELICKETNKWYVGCQIGKIDMKKTRTA